MRQTRARQVERPINSSSQPDTRPWQGQGPPSLESPTWQRGASAKSEAHASSSPVSRGLDCRGQSVAIASEQHPPCAKMRCEMRQAAVRRRCFSLAGGGRWVAISRPRSAQGVWAPAAAVAGRGSRGGRWLWGADGCGVMHTACAWVGPEATGRGYIGAAYQPVVRRGTESRGLWGYASTAAPAPCSMPALGLDGDRKRAARPTNEKNTHRRRSNGKAACCACRGRKPRAAEAVSSYPSPSTHAGIKAHIDRYTCGPYAPGDGPLGTARTDGRARGAPAEDRVGDTGTCRRSACCVCFRGHTPRKPGHTSRQPGLVLAARCAGLPHAAGA